MTRLSSRRRRLVRSTRHLRLFLAPANTLDGPEEKARKEMAAKAGGKGPLNTGGQGIKKSGKK